MYRAFALRVSFLSLTLAALLSPALTLALTPPTLADYNESSFSDTGTNDETTGVVSWQASDIVIVLGATADNTVTLGTPTATGLSFNLVDSTSGGSTARTYLWSATAGSSGSSAVASDGTSGSSGDTNGISVFVYRGSDGLGIRIRKRV